MSKTIPNKSPKKDVMLAHPFTFEGEQITTLQMREPRVKDVLPAQTVAMTAADAEVAVFAALTGQPPALIEELHMKDYLRLQAQYQDFLD